MSIFIQFWKKEYNSEKGYVFYFLEKSCKCDKNQWENISKKWPGLQREAALHYGTGSMKTELRANGDKW